MFQQNAERLALLQKAVQTHKQNTYDVRTVSYSHPTMYFCTKTV